jgi:hypothetical protein
VTLGFDDGRMSEVTEGLHGGDLVAMNVGQTARDGEPVSPHLGATDRANSAGGH